VNDLELTNTGVFAVVKPTSDQLHEARLGIPAAMLEDDRELSADVIECECGIRLRRAYAGAHRCADYDPTPWCHVCGARKRENCHCGPIAENE
jgi:hypothetical protein